MTGSRTILVTGASSGIGAHCARALKGDGWRVFATARKDADIAALAADGLEALYLDYREEESIAAAFDEVAARTGGKLDALFNNGGYAQPGAVEDLPVAALREQFEANFFGWHALARRAVAAVRAGTVCVGTGSREVRRDGRRRPVDERRRQCTHWKSMSIEKSYRCDVERGKPIE